MIAPMHSNKPDSYRLLNHEGEEKARGSYADVVAELEVLYPVELDVEPGGVVSLDGYLIARIVPVEETTD